MKAIHIPTGRVYAPDEVDDATRPGPWSCVSPRCDARLFHSRSFDRKLPSGDTTIVAAKFSCFRDSAHSSEPHGAPARGDRDSVLGDASREHIHRLTDVPLPERTKQPPTDGASTGATRRQFPYGTPIGGVRGLVSFSQRVAEDAEFANVEQIRYSGTDYWWKELAFAPTGRSFQDLDATIRAQFTKDRAYYVEGAAKYRAFPVRNAERLELTLREIGGTPEVEVSVFMPNERYFQELVSSAESGSRFALFSSESLVKKTGRVALSLSTESQLIAMERA